MSISPNPNLFAGNPLNRMGVARKDPDWVNSQRNHPAARLLLFSKGQPLTTDMGGRPAPAYLGLPAFDQLPTRAELVLLGCLDGEPYWAADIGDAVDPWQDFGAFIPMREAAMAIAPDDAAIAGLAAWLLGWHHRHRFSHRSGAETVPADGGFKRIEPGTDREYFPRTDPVAIMLPTHNDHVCMGRSPHFPEGMMSAFAGFVEACETLEECAARELFEEVGLVTERLEYVFSQPWPFPASLMVGFIAPVTGRELVLDPDEIADARWFSRTEIQNFLNGDGPAGYFLPPPMAIAHQLLKVWAAR